MTPYSEIEEAVRQAILAHYSDLLTDDLCLAADIDKLVDNLLSQNAPYGVILDYAGGRQQQRPEFAKSIWAWTIGVVFFIRYTGDTAETDARLRDVIDRLPGLFVDRRLGGKVVLATLTQIEEPEPGLMNDVPFYALYFNIEVLVKEE